MTRHRSIQAVVNSDRFRSSSSRNADRIPGRATFSPEIRLEESGAAVLNATDPDLSAFRERGGKLILFHGWSDGAIPAVNTINYYRSVVAKAGAKEAETFVRLYMVPGMQHSGGGPGPDVFGHVGTARGDRTHDIDTALEDWVKQSVAPAQIVASKYKGSPRSGGGDVVRTRPLCPYPLVAEYTGKGSTDEAANFSCMTR